MPRCWRRGVIILHCACFCGGGANPGAAAAARAMAYALHAHAHGGVGGVAYGVVCAALLFRENGLEI